jgi:hypothetical protein
MGETFEAMTNDGLKEFMDAAEKVSSFSSLHIFFAVGS